VKRTILATVVAICSSSAMAGQIIYEFKNPAFGNDPAAWSSQAMTIENLEFSRRQAQEAQKKAEADAAQAAAQNTNLAKFMNNLESRIYAQLSLQLSNAMFSDGSTSGTMDFQGSTISWIKDTVAGTISLTVIDETGNKTDITVPMGSFKF